MIFSNFLFRWLTNNCYRLTHAPDAADLRSGEVENTIALAKDGQAFAAAHVFEVSIHSRFQDNYYYYISRDMPVKDQLVWILNSYLQRLKQLLEMD